MYRKTVLFAMVVAFMPGLVHAACSHANLTRCLDSACAINISTNPAARCQYCGTASAGTPPTGMRSVSAGTNTKYNISDKELKKAPTDPGERYVWATNQCLERVADCTPDDVSDVYDQLIEQSCTAAGINAEMAALHNKLTQTKSESACVAEISECVTSDTKCMSDFGACTEDADFDKFFSACATVSTGCDAYTAGIRSDLLASRTSQIQNANAILNAAVLALQDERARKLNSARAMCTNNAGRESCIVKMCDERMPNKCAVGFESEKSAATQLCKYYDNACDALKL